VFPSRPVTVGAVNIEFNTASSDASTTAVNNGSSARPVSTDVPSGLPSRSSRIPVPNAMKISPLPWCAVEPERASPKPTRRARREHEAPSTGASVTTMPMQEPAGFRSPVEESSVEPVETTGPSARPTCTPFTISSSRAPKFVIRRTATVWSPTTRDAVPIPPLKPRQDIPVPEPTAPSSGAVDDPREASAAPYAATTSSCSTCIRRASLSQESSHSATTGMMKSTALDGLTSSSIRHAES
jgi:hypothetical protein